MRVMGKSVEEAAAKQPSMYDRCPFCDGLKKKASKRCAVCWDAERFADPPTNDPATRFVNLTKGHLATIDSEEYERVTQLRWAVNIQYRKDGSVKNFYAMSSSRQDAFGVKRRILLHRFILGVTDPAIKIDHKDRNGLNCRKKNLRDATERQNQQNCQRRGHNTSGYKGVSWYKAKEMWQAKIVIDGKQKHLGFFHKDDIVPAARAYDKAAVEAFGEFACTNVTLGLLPPLDLVSA